MTSWEIRMMPSEPLYPRPREPSGAMQEAKAVNLGSQRAGVEGTHEG